MWGNEAWDVDVTADSLNTSLFGRHKKKKLKANTSSTQQHHEAHVPDSDDETFSKKGRKKLKERKRKQKKQHGTTNNDDIFFKNESAVVGVKHSKGKDLHHMSYDSQAGDVPHQKTLTKVKDKDDIKIKTKQERKRSIFSMENDDQVVKKKKKQSSVGSNRDRDIAVTTQVRQDQSDQEKKRAHRKKNNSKKNKYKHLALNSSPKNPSNTFDNTSADYTFDNTTADCRNNESHVTTNQDTVEIPVHHISKMSTVSNNCVHSPDGRLLKKKKRRNKALGLENNLCGEKSNDCETETQILNERKVKTKKKQKRKSVNCDDDMSKALSEHVTKLNKLKLASMLGSPSGGTDRISTKFGKDQNTSTTSSVSSIWNLQSSEPGQGTLDLKQAAKEKLNAARFRFINEQLYSCSGKDAFRLFMKDREAFQVYHKGYQSQVEKWTVNPLDVIIKQTKSKPTSLKIADFGCGDAQLSQSLSQEVFSFDLVALNERVTVCDMSKTPLEKESVDIAVFCLSLMGTNISDYILEANRVLKKGGLLKIAEVVSRFGDPDVFIKALSSHGFALLNKIDISDMFYLMDFKKTKSIKKSPAAIRLKPCVYKKR